MQSVTKTVKVNKAHSLSFNKNFHLHILDIKLKQEY